LDDALHHLLPWDIELTIDEPVDESEEEPEVQEWIIFTHILVMINTLFLVKITTLRWWNT
jgi:hypothetical protein